METVRTEDLQIGQSVRTWWDSHFSVVAGVDPDPDIDSWLVVRLADGTVHKCSPSFEWIPQPKVAGNAIVNSWMLEYGESM